ncbi:hypothetical protein ACNKHV_03290 [Shigella flexneri]
MKTKARRWAAQPASARSDLGEELCLTKLSAKTACKRRFCQIERPMLVDYVQRELADGSRTVVETEHWLAVVPYWAALLFDMLPSSPTFYRITDSTHAQRDPGAGVEKKDQLLRQPLPVLLPLLDGWHGAPFNGEENQHWQLHAHF